MAIGNRKFSSFDQRDFIGISGPPRAAKGSALVVNFASFKEGIGIHTNGFTADINGGYNGSYYIDSNHHVDFKNVSTFKITGTDYADTIQVGDGNDIVNAGGGNDLVILGFGKDKADGGAGIDGYDKSFAGLNAGVTLNLQTNSISIKGSTAKNFEYFHNVIGTDFDDTFVSSLKRGDDTVTGGEGDDTALFAIGYDKFVGGAGNDTAGANFSLYSGFSGIQTSLVQEDSGEGYHGYFYVDGATRTDFATTENFQVTGTANRDVISTGTGNDVVNGGDGNDVIDSASGTDTLDGGNGIDGVGRDFSLLTDNIAIDLGAGTLTGTGGAITHFEYFSGIRGGEGDDTFLGTTALANDNVSGGIGDDIASFYAGTDVYAGGAGKDRAIIDYSLVSVAGIQTSLTADNDGGYKGYFYIDQPHRVDFTSVESFAITGTTFDDGIQTGDGNDIVSSGNGNDVVQTGAGVDILDGGDGIDGVGRNLSGLNKAVKIDLDADKATGPIGKIVNFEYFAGYSGSQKSDTLISTHAQANDSVAGGGGNDTLTVFAGTDTFAGGIGTDRLIIDYSAVDAGVGIQTSFSADTAGGGFKGYFYINQPNRIDFTSTEAFTITGTAYDDAIVTRTGDDKVSGGDGNDVVDTGSGKDVDDGGAGFDGIGRDLSGLLGSNITFNLETGKLLGAKGNSIKNFEYLYDVKTSNGNDTFVTLHNNGNDTVSSGTGNDTLNAFGGYDRFSAGGGSDTLNVDYSWLSTDNGIQTSIGVDSTNGGFQGYFYVDGGNRTDFNGCETFNIIATNNDDSIAGGTGADTLIGLDGRDTLTGNGGNDTLDGGGAADVLNGGQGKDTLIAGGGADTLTGGTEADTFVFKTADFGPLDPFALDRITDFASGSDKIDLSGIDANKGANGDQAFKFVTGAFTDVGQVHVVTGAGGFLYLEGNWDNNLAADFSIRVDGSAPIASDLVL